MVRPLHILLSSISLVYGYTTLVVTDESTEPHGYEAFWKSLRHRGHDLAFREHKAALPLLHERDEAKFDNLIFLATSSKSLQEDLSPRSLVQFLDQGGNILFAASPNISEHWRDFAREFDIEFDASQTTVKDRFIGQGKNYELLALDASKAWPGAVSGAMPSINLPVLYRGIGHRRGSNPLIMDVLSTPATSVSEDVTEVADNPSIQPFLIGGDIALVSAFQTRRNARVGFLGSLDALSDDVFGNELSGNAEFFTALTAWTFQQRGVLRIVSARHRALQELANSGSYRVGQELVYELEIQAFESGAWVAFPASDIQVEFVMLDPYLRSTLSAMPTQQKGSNSSILTASFQVPDRHGVFTFKLDYRRPGWSFLQTREQVSVTPFRHDEYPRFISGAIPYYSGALSTAFAFSCLVLVWITHKPAAL